MMGLGGYYYCQKCGRMYKHHTCPYCKIHYRNEKIIEKKNLIKY